MKFVSKTSLGIDISDGRINLALLKKDVSGIRLLKSACCPIPQGAIRDGNIEDAVSLAEAIKDLKTKNKIRANYTALSLVANPVLLQILEIPKDFSGNIGQFVRNEVKQYAILPIKNVAIDYCGLRLSANADIRRVVVAATDNQKIIETVKKLNKIGVNIDAVEPASTAYIRSCFAGKIEKSFDKNQLFVLIRDNVLTVSVFKNQTLEFLRTKYIEAEVLQSDGNLKQLGEEINTVIRFQELDNHNEPAKWEVTVVTDIFGSSTEETAELLKSKSGAADLTVRTPQTAYLDTKVTDAGHPDKPSAVAIGLAMKFSSSSGSGLDLNLVPAEIEQLKTAKKQALLIGNIAAVILLIMFLSASFLGIKATQISRGQVNQTQLLAGTRSLLEQQQSIGEEIAGSSETLAGVRGVLNSAVFIKWAQILDDIRLAIPKQMRLTNLFGGRNSKIVLEGQADGYEPVYLFTDTLKKCKHIKSTSLNSCKKDADTGLIKYAIDCSLVE